ncbi:MAG: hypothetical protein ACK4S0_15480, partial [Sediminibacterium sp.]
MKATKILIFTITLLCIYQNGKAQTVNWNALKKSRHIISAGMGWDYSISYGFGYGYQMKTKIPLILSANFSIPSGENLLDDLKTKIGAQMMLWNTPNIKASVTLIGIYRRYENSLARLQNFGSEMKGTLGYYKTKWFVAGEVGFDKAIVTHFKHSQIFRETIFPDVKDGWYEPSTGGNFYYGIQTGYSFKMSDIILNSGIIITQDFKTSPLIPYY